MSIPKISVILSVFNGEAHLLEALESVLNQTEPSLEVIVVDDGSTDGTASILQQVGANDDRLVVITQKNAGVYIARNNALAQAKGEWITFLDADDWVQPETYETWLRSATSEETDLLIGNGFSFASEPTGEVGKNLLLQHQPEGRVLSGSDWIVHCVAAGEWPHYIWLQLIRRSLIEEAGIRFLPGFAHLDIVWTTHLALAANRIGFCKLPLCGYRRNPGSISRCPSEPASIKRARSYLIVLKELISLARGTSNRDLRKALLRQSNREAGHFFGLIRKRISTRSMKRELAAEFLELRVPAAMMEGAGNAREVWRAIRFWLVITKIRLTSR